MSEWISVKKELPKQNKNVLLLINRGCSLSGGFICVGYLLGDTFQCCVSTSMVTFYHTIEHVTDWMPLPELPKEEA